jgi:cytochrome c-type biogenesis protein CcsB
MGRLEIPFAIALYGYLAATVVYWLWFFWRKRSLWIAGTSLLAGSAAVQVVFIVALGVVAGRPPFKDTFETMVFFAAAFAVFFLAALLFLEAKPLAPVAGLAALLVTLFAYLIMPDTIDHLVPALRNSFWLTVHVAFSFVSYVGFLFAYLGAIAFLLKTKRYPAAAGFVVALTLAGLAATVGIVVMSWTEPWLEHRRLILSLGAAFAILLAVGLWPLLGVIEKRLRFTELLPEKSVSEKLVYGSVAFGFPFLTLGIVTGSYWASQAWGRYWGWDPKETASLVTWLVFAIYLHMRLVPKWRGPWVAWIAVGGFWFVLFTFFGVNYLLPGLHSYG